MQTSASPPLLPRFFGSSVSFSQLPAFARSSNLLVLHRIPISPSLAPPPSWKGFPAWGVSVPLQPPSIPPSLLPLFRCVFDYTFLLSAAAVLRFSTPSGMFLGLHFPAALDFLTAHLRVSVSAGYFSSGSSRAKASFSSFFLQLFEPYPTVQAAGTLLFFSARGNSWALMKVTEPLPVFGVAERRLSFSILFGPHPLFEPYFY